MIVKENLTENDINNIRLPKELDDQLVKEGFVGLRVKDVDYFNMICIYEGIPDMAIKSSSDSENYPFTIIKDFTTGRIYRKEGEVGKEIKKEEPTEDNSSIFFWGK